MEKTAIAGNRARSRVIDNIIDAIVTRQGFLLLGHKSPDEDCIASMVAFALLAAKFSKDICIYLGKHIHEHFQYLLNICTYNSIPILYQDDPLPVPIDTVVLFDTAKPSMIEANALVQGIVEDEGTLKIEIDHHLGSDSDYFGQNSYRLVTEASSSGELVGHILLRLKENKKLLKRFQINDLASRNIVLAILTGIIGDSKMGLYLKSEREKKYYRVFSAMFNEMLAEKTTRRTNFSDMQQVFQEIQRLSRNEEHCFNYFMERKRFSKKIGYVVLGERDIDKLSSEFDNDTIVSVARGVADILAEESKWLGLVCYSDPPDQSDLIQFRLRRSHLYKAIDLRTVLKVFSISNGGGHQGAIGFRIPKSEVDDLENYSASLIRGIEDLIKA
jgi:nanoRNase/pAp phosphatase (c-di-AMP/oligoRNAs hydrolase)